MKILHTSDWHVGKSLRGRSRADEHRRALEEMAAIAAEERVDLVLVAGDLFDSAAPTPEAEMIVYRGLLDLAETGATVVAVAGNHDNPRRLDAVRPLLELGEILTAPALRPAGDGGVRMVETSGGEVARLALVPFLSQRYIVRADDLMGLEGYQYEQAYAGRMGAIVDHLTAAAGSDTVNLVVGHIMVAGGAPGGGERPAHTVFDYAVPAAVFPGSLHYVALGHLHRQQRVPASPPTWYSGSPLQLDFGETREDKGVLLVEAVAGAPAEVTARPLSAGRRLAVVRGTLEQLEAAAPDAPDAYLRVVVEGSPRAGLNEQVREWFPDAIDVIMDPTEPAADAVGSAPRLGRAPAELFAEYLAHRGIEDDRLQALFAELLEEVHASDPA